MTNDIHRHATLLKAAARAAKNITTILDPYDLLQRTVDIICDEFGFYYAGVFFLDDAKQYAVLKAGRGEAGREMIHAGHRLAVGGNSMIGACIANRQGRIALDVGAEAVFFENPHLPKTRSEMALPLVVGEDVIGALTVQSTEEAAFHDEDIAALQTMADQIAIAINNAQLMFKLEDATAELVRSKTFEAIATATGEAIHWVGNKAAPIPGSIKRVREDIRYILALAAEYAPRDLDAKNVSLMEAVETIREEAQAMGIDLIQILAEMSAMKPNRLRALVSVESLMEDLDIAENSAETILSIKEGLIGPARQRNDAPVSLRDMIADTVANMGLPDGVVEMDWADNVPNAFVDARQVEQVFNNLIKNAWEAMSQTPEPHIHVKGQRDSDPGFVLVTVKDNGPGIPKEIQEKIWVSFFTTKGGSGGTGLGLSAVMQIVNQHGGSISLESEAGKGATFSVRLPVEKKT